MARKAVKKASKTKPAPKPKGRPAIYTPVLGERVLSLLAGGQSLRAVCRHATMPSRTTVLKWLAEDAEFAGQYARACEARTESLVEEMLEIADDDKLDPQDKRVRVDTRKWLASKLLPKKYGDKVELGGRVTLEQLVGASLPPAE